jgi:uncharacterized protein (DUF927 family)
LGHVARFDKADGSKVVLPLTLWRVAGQLRWQWKAFPDPRPLYGLQRLAEHPSAPVLVVEGEKAAEAASERLQGCTVITWPGGSKATAKADWGPLAGRDVVIWPDADAPGAKAARDVERLTLAAGAASAAVVRIPEALPDGWDLADDWPAGFGRAEAEAAIATARAAARPAGIEWPFGYRMEREAIEGRPPGLYFDQPVKDGATVPQRLSAAFEVLAEARDDAGNGWAVVLRFVDRDGREKTIVVSRARLATGGAEVRAELADAGLVVSPSRGKADKFSAALAEVRCDRRMRLVSATGWAGSHFVLPGLVVGPAGGDQVLFTGAAASLRYGQRGSLGNWRENIARLATGNDRLVFAISVAFAAPLLRLLKIEGGGFHFRGNSSVGKSTIGMVAGSVWGGGDGTLGFAQSWKTTGNALEGVALGHNDTLMVLDEINLVAPEELGPACYMLNSGQPKARSRADGSLRQRQEWSLLYISNGELSLAEHIRSGRRGDHPMVGQELRLIDVPADAGIGLGAWQHLHGAASHAEFAKGLKEAVARDFGHAGPAFVERVALGRDAAEREARVVFDLFLEEAQQPDDSGQVRRAAQRFALVAAGGELAIQFGILPWPVGAASEAALRLYRQWAEAFGRDAPQEVRQILRRLKSEIEANRAMFSPVGEDDVGEDSRPSAGGRDGEARAMSTHGYREVAGPDVLYWLHDTGWATVFKGFDLREAAKVVLEAGYLKPGEDGRYKRRRKIRGERSRLYCVKGSIIEHDFGD